MFDFYESQKICRRRQRLRLHELHWFKREKAFVGKLCLYLTPGKTFPSDAYGSWLPASNLHGNAAATNMAAMFEPIQTPCWSNMAAITQQYGRQMNQYRRYVRGNMAAKWINMAGGKVVRSPRDGWVWYRWPRINKGMPVVAALWKCDKYIIHAITHQTNTRLTTVQSLHASVKDCALYFIYLIWFRLYGCVRWSSMWRIWA